LYLLLHATGGAKFVAMNLRRKKISMKARLEEAIDELGGEPLAGSGFEDERPDEGFSGAVLLPSTFLPGNSRASRSDQQS
jgi:hypothetical protein